ncbi:hypothetical protein I7I48_05204 [Histoplasma ohiense]|nr:hypothetical protein I7I48_05204 [Histoplasma ohiense (nom. inval.)]
MSCYVIRGACRTPRTRDNTGYHDPLPSLAAPCLPLYSNYDQRSFVGEIVPITKKASPERDSYRLSACQTPFYVYLGMHQHPQPPIMYIQITAI